MFKPSTGCVGTLALVAIAQGVALSAPLPNLVMACPAGYAIGQDFESCIGYAYQIPTNQLIVFSGSSILWSRASDLAGYDLVLVCKIPVEPGAYSSCRDAAGIRRTAYVPKDSVITVRNSVIVSKTGGDYTDPVTAAKNAFEGDTWCVAPQWPSQPCVMAIGTGVFILRETLNIPAGLAVSGNGKGDTMLVADNGVENAVFSFGNFRVSALTIINSQPGRGRTTGLAANNQFFSFPPVGSFQGPGSGELHDVAIHVAGAAQNTAVLLNNDVRLEILDSEISAVGQDATGISVMNRSFIGGARMTLERSHVSAEAALSAPNLGGAGENVVRLVDSHLSGDVFFDLVDSALEIVRSEIVGDVTAKRAEVVLVVTGSSIKGRVDARASLGDIQITNTNVEGGLIAGGGFTATFDTVRVNGFVELWSSVSSDPFKFLGSYINNSTGVVALSLQRSNVQLEHTFVQGATAVAINSGSNLKAFESVLVGNVVPDAVSPMPHCTETYGADARGGAYELLSESCQPQAP